MSGVAPFGLFFRIFFPTSFMDVFWERFGSILEPFWARFGDLFGPKWHQNASRRKNMIFTKTYELQWILMIFRVGEGPKSRLVRSRRRLLARPKTNSIFASIFDRKSHQNDLKMEPQIVPKSFQPLSKSILEPFLSILGPKIRKK